MAPISCGETRCKAYRICNQRLIYKATLTTANLVSATHAYVCHLVTVAWLSSLSSLWHGYRHCHHCGMAIITVITMAWLSSLSSLCHSYHHWHHCGMAIITVAWLSSLWHGYHHCHHCGMAVITVITVAWLSSLCHGCPGRSTAHSGREAAA